MVATSWQSLCLKTIIAKFLRLCDYLHTDIAVDMRAGFVGEEDGTEIEAHSKHGRQTGVYIRR